jgi:predicted metalloendopeptidase
VILPSLSVVSCHHAKPATAVYDFEPDTVEVAKPKPPAKEITLAQAGVNASWMDRSADPCTDFYKFSCGGWMAANPIPADYSTWDVTRQMEEDNLSTLKDLLEKAKAAPATDEVSTKISAFYTACTDEAAIEKADAKPMAPMLAVVAKVKDSKSLTAALIELHSHRMWALFDIGAQQDFKDATQVITGVDQDGLGLPDRDYYVGDDKHLAEIREFYVAHVEKSLVLAGMKPAAAKQAATDVMRIETEIAKLSQTRVERRDPYKVYNRVERDGLAKAAPHIDWDAYWKGIGFPDVKAISVTSVEYVKGIDALTQSEKPAAWKNYLTWTVVRSMSPWLSKRFDEEQFALQQKLQGLKQQLPRWKRCVNATDDALGELLGQPYVAVKFSGDSKDLAEGVVTNVKGAMGTELASLAWMDDATRKVAQEKLGKMFDQIGYPSKWRVYDFKLSSSDYAANWLAAQGFEFRRQMNKVGKPVDRTEFQMTPPTVNAYYDSSLNEMVFPAGILQPPAFSKDFIDAVNYGATGSTVGHELTHGFDDEGAQFDPDGNLRNWWSESTAKEFKADGKCVSALYSTFEVTPGGIKENGDLTNGENIADIGGLKLAFAAYHKVRAKADAALVADGFSEDQMFFIAYAQTWCTNERPEREEEQVRTNEHSLARFRVLGPLQSIPAFADTFQCKAGSVMRPAKVCTVW